MLEKSILAIISLLLRSVFALLLRYVGSSIIGRELLLWNISNTYILNFIVGFSIALHAFRDHELQLDQITLHVLSHSYDTHPK